MMQYNTIQYNTIQYTHRTHFLLTSAIPLKLWEQAKIAWREKIVWAAD